MILSFAIPLFRHIFFGFFSPFLFVVKPTNVQVGPCCGNDISVLVPELVEEASDPHCDTSVCGACSCAKSSLASRVVAPRAHWNHGGRRIHNIGLRLPTTLLQLSTSLRQANPLPMLIGFLDNAP